MDKQLLSYTYYTLQNVTAFFRHIVSFLSYHTISEALSPTECVPISAPLLYNWTDTSTRIAATSSVHTDQRPLAFPSNTVFSDRFEVHASDWKAKIKILMIFIGSSGPNLPTGRTVLFTNMWKCQYLFSDSHSSENISNIEIDFNIRTVSKRNISCLQVFTPEKHSDVRAIVSLTSRRISHFLQLEVLP